MTHIVSILSDELAPNLLFVLQMGLEHENQIFISTPQMEAKGKSKILKNVLHLEYDPKVIVVNANNPRQILEKLEAENLFREDEYIVNITGGNKLMSQMTYNHFAEFPNSKMYYWPIGANHIELLHPNLISVPLKNIVELDLPSYFATYGYEILSTETTDHEFQVAKKLMTDVLKAGNAFDVAQIRAAWKQSYTGDNKGYLTGGWFEEWMYRTIKNGLHLSDDDIGLNLKIKSYKSVKDNGNDNELDVCFIYKNALYLVECKVFSSTRKGLGGEIVQAIYKSSSIRGGLGLRAKALVAILTDFGDSQDRAARILDAKTTAGVEEVFSMRDFFTKDLFLTKLRKMVNYG